MTRSALRGMPLLLVCALFAAIAFRTARPLSDPDVWWHLRLGNDMIEQKSLAAPEQWSSFATIQWVPTEPIPEIVAAYVDRWAGLPGLAVLYAAGALVLVLIVYLVCRQEASALPAAVTTTLSLLAVSASLTSRPQLVSFVMLPIVVAAWLRTERDHRTRWWLIPLSWIWSLCHGFWFLGVGYAIVFVIGFALSRGMPRPVLLRQVAVAVGSFAVVALNPVGVGVIEAPFAVHGTSKYIEEWHRTDLMSAQALGAIAMVSVTALIWTVTRRGGSWPRILVLLSALVWIWYAGRTVAVAGLVVAPILAGALDVLLRMGATCSEPHELAGARRREIVALVVAAAIASLAVVLAAPSRARDPGDVPLAMDSALDRLPPGTRVFNTYELGGWIAWRHPDLNQYIDGLITPYSERHAHDYVVAETASPGWQGILSKSGAVVALLEESSPLAHQLAERGWVSQQSDDGYVLLMKPGPSG